MNPTAVDKAVALMESMADSSSPCPVCRGGWFFDQDECFGSVHAPECPHLNQELPLPEPGTFDNRWFAHNKRAVRAASNPASGRTITATITGDGSGVALPPLEDSVGVEPIPRIAGPELPGASPQDSQPATKADDDSPFAVTCRCGGAEAGRINFDRSLCACGAMHYFCDDCGCQVEECDPASRSGDE